MTVADGLESPNSPRGPTDVTCDGEFAVLVREELQRVLASSQFQSSKLCQAFLKYVVESALDGHTENLKERVIGIAVFGKEPSYYTSEDAGVRVKASEVRKRLQLYYANAPADTVVIIDLPIGKYVPAFRRVDGPKSRAPESRYTGSWTFWILAILVVATGIVTAAYRWLPRHVVPSSLDSFWSPLFEGKKSALLSVTAIPVYTRIRDQRPNEPIRPGDFIQIQDRFLAVSDMNAALQISDMLAKNRWPYRLQVGSDVSFHELRNSPVILVGFSYTQWNELSNGFRYSIDLDRRPFGILDRGAATNWTIPTHPDDPALSEDYAIVSRVFDLDTQSMIVEIAGISHYGTEAAAELVTSPALLAIAFQGAPAGWQKKNLQIVLHVKVIAGSPSAPNVVATYFW
jgi:hypothetical protein